MVENLAIANNREHYFLNNTAAEVLRLLRNMCRHHNVAVNQHAGLSLFLGKHEKNWGIPSAWTELLHGDMHSRSEFELKIGTI